MNAPSRPVLRWRGGKWRIAPWVIAHFPAHKVYVEPFGGSASVLLRKPPAVSEIFNDLDSDVVNLFRVLRERSSAFADALELTPFAREEYESCYAATADELERARRFVARSFMGMSSKGALKKSGFDTRINADGYASRLNSLINLPPEIGIIAERLRGVIIENCGAFELIPRHDAAHTLFYLDPPYEGADESYRHRFSTDAHRRLARLAKSLKGMVVLSGYESDIYDAELAGWLRVSAVANVDSGASGSASRRAEILWINPSAADRLSPAHFSMVSA
jgi:DNA adenine methylase